MAKGLFQSLREEIKEKYGLTRNSIDFVPFESDWREKLQTYPAEFKSEWQSNLSLLKRRLKLSDLSDVENPNKKLILFFGISGSGKTTLARIVAESIPNTVLLRGHVIVDMLNLYGKNIELYRERLRKRHFETPDPWYISYLYQEQLTRDILDLGYNVVFDDHIRTRENRQGYSRLARSCEAKIVFIRIDAPFETCVRRTTKREEDRYKITNKMVRFLANFVFQSEDISDSERKKYNGVVAVDGTSNLKDLRKYLVSQLSSV